jgi:hypothetical protein
MGKGRTLCWLGIPIGIHGALFSERGTRDQEIRCRPELAACTPRTMETMQFGASRKERQWLDGNYFSFVYEAKGCRVRDRKE